jgi:hypothetical protein
MRPTLTKIIATEFIVLKEGKAGFYVGSRVAIQPENLSKSRQYLANATGEIIAIKGNKASVLLDKPNKRRTVKIDLCSLRLTSAQEWEQDSLQRKGDNCHTIKDDKHHKIELCQRTEDQKLQKNTGNCINKDLAVKMSVKPSELEETLCGKSSKITATTLEQKNCSHLLNLRENDTPQTMTGITDVQNAITTSSYIELSGNNKMGLFQTVITSTIKTETNQTTESKTLNVLPLQNTEQFTDFQKDTSLSLDSYHTTQEPLEDLTQEKFILHQDAQQQQLEEVNEQSGKQSLTKPNQQELIGSTQTRCLQQSIYVQELGQVSLMPHSCLEDLSLKDSVNPMNGVSQFSNADFQVSESIQMLEHSPREKLENNLDRSTVFLPPHHAPHSQLKENVWEALTQETVSPPSYDKLDSSNPNSQLLKTCLDCYQPPLFPEPNPAHILGRCSGSFSQVGTMHNGLLSEHPSLELSGQEKGSCLLPRPGALSWSGNGRPPGTTKSEAAAKKLGIIQKNEVFNPDWLEVQFGLPVGWTSPQEHRAATALLATVELPSETVLTPDLQRSPLEEFCTCPSCGETLLNLADGCGVCGWQKVLEESKPYSLEKSYQYLTVLLTTDVVEKVLEDEMSNSLEKTSKRIAPSEITSNIQVASSSSGSLYCYLKNIKLKSGQIASYPRVEGERDPDNLNHWYWGYNYKVLEDGVWKSKSLSVPKEKVSMVLRMIENNAPVAAIKDFIKVLGDSSSNFLEKECDVAPSPCLEKVLEDKQSFSLERLQASGCLYKYLKNKKLKSGAVASYPRVDGTRNPDNPDHWYWGYSYEVLEDGEWKGRSLSVPRYKVTVVQAMIDNHQPISVIQNFLEGRKKLI